MAGIYLVGDEQQIILDKRSLLDLIKYLTSRDIKCVIFRILISPVLTYGSDKWMLTKSNEWLLEGFERKMLSKEVVDGGVVTGAIILSYVVYIDILIIKNVLK